MGRLIRSVLVPNRGEIALRIARCCGEMGIRSVLAAADDDLESYASRYFNDVVPLGPGDARQTYLNVDRIIDAARAVNADAIHPGYGFLSERAALSAACEDAGIIFVGPRAETIELMGSKTEARRLMAKAGVPIVPGYDGDDQSDDTLREQARRLGFPVLIKPSGGGGGKGMKVVRRAEELTAALESSRREATSSFGDDRLLLERFLEQPRHIEFQVFGDARGQIVHLFERDCSAQRRHQKVIEESPAPQFSDDLRARMAAAAVAAAAAVSYRNAGTVEFIVTPDGEFYFLEMNTRIQVEHPVTEMVVDVDLLRAQFAVAQEEPLPWSQDQLTQRGHAIECRIYAEDPDQGFLPQAGTIVRFSAPAGPGIRVDSGVETGSEIHVKYDPMLAKVIAWAEDRNKCIDRLRRALADSVILGPTTNVGYLRRVLAHQTFRAGAMTTEFLGAHTDELRAEDGDEAAIAAVLAGLRQRPRKPLAPSRVPTVWETLGPWGRS